MSQVLCIDPEVGAKVAALERRPLAENAAELSHHPSERAELAVHWVACPYCRENLPYTNDLLKLAARVIEDRVALSLNRFYHDWTSRTELNDGTNLEDCAQNLALLAIYGVLAQGGLCFVVQELADFTTELIPSESRSQRISLSRCADLILSLEPTVRSFLFEAIQCQEILMPPIVQDLGPINLPFPKNLDEMQREEYAKAQNLGHMEQVQDVWAKAIKEACGEAIIPVYHGILIESHSNFIKFSEAHPDLEPLRNIKSSPSMSGGSLDLRFDDLSQQLGDGFDSLKAGQMEILRRMEENGRSAQNFEKHIESQMGGIYRCLNPRTQRHLQLAEYMSSINDKEPDYSHSTVLYLAFAYENELLVRLIRPFLESRIRTGDQVYDGGGLRNRSLILGGRVQERNLSLGNFAWYLNQDPQLRAWINGSTKFDLNSITHDLERIVPKRDDAAHKPMCRRSTADDLRDWIYGSDSPFIHLLNEA